MHAEWIDLNNGWIKLLGCDSVLIIIICVDVFVEHLNYRGNIFMAITMNECENDGTEQFSYSLFERERERGKKKKKRKGEWIGEWWQKNDQMNTNT